MKLIQKLTLGFLSIALLLAVVGGIQVAFIHEIKDDVDEIADSNIGEVQGAIDIAYRVALIGADISAYLLETLSGSENQGQARKQEILDDFAHLESAFTGLKSATETGLALAEDNDDEDGEKSEMEAIASLEIRLDEYRGLIEQTFDTLDTQGAQAAVAMFLDQDPVLDQRIRDESQDLFIDAIEEIQEAVEEVGESVEASVIYTVGLTLAAFVLALAIGVLVSRSLSKRIRQLQTATRALQHGDREVQVESINSKDEVAELARELKTSTTSIDDLNGQIRKRKRAEAALQKAHDGLEDRVRQRTRELEGARLEAESANRTKSEFLANMSHELRTPLNHIIGFTELIVGGKLGGVNEMQKEYLTDALTSSHHLLALINDILDLSKVEAGKLKLLPSMVKVQDLLNNCLVMFKEKAMKHRIAMNLEIENAPETILADEIKMKQILYNLLSNAFKFTPDAGRISLRAWQVNGDDASRPKGLGIHGNDLQTAAWAISISDSGIGIPPDDLETIFNPFEQASNQEKDHQEGTGLGLALTRRMVELHGGAIQAESNGRDQGATFTIMLPETVEIPAAQE